MIKNSKSIGLIITSLVYIIGIVGATLLYDVIAGILPKDLSTNILLILAILDVALTIFVFLFSTIFNNASIYDPYWSVIPMWLIIVYALKAGVISNPYVLVIIITIFIWGLRLTFNWVYTFKNLNVQDWRYQNFQDKHPKLFPLINFFGIHLVPTLVVFIGMLPAFKYLDMFTRTCYPSVGIFIGVAISIVGVLFELIADIQMHKFRKDPCNKGKVNNRGIWKLSRHPNYFGEIIFWVGICLMSMSFINDVAWPLVFCPLIMFLLFACISIPMMEKRQLKRRPEYQDYIDSTYCLFPLGSKSK